MFLRRALTYWTSNFQKQKICTLQSQRWSNWTRDLPSPEFSESILEEMLVTNLSYTPGPIKTYQHFMHCQAL